MLPQLVEAFVQSTKTDSAQRLQVQRLASEDAEDGVSDSMQQAAFIKIILT